MDPNPLLSWTAPSKPTHVRGKRWYVVAGAIVTVLLIYAFWTQAWTFVAVLILLTILYVLLHGKPHPEHTVRITEKALYWDEKTILWEELAGFWMLQGPGYVELHIEWKTKGKERLVIQTGTMDPHQIAVAFSRFLPGFTDRREKILDYIIRICKL